jgi:hypothetical protein
MKKVLSSLLFLSMGLLNMGRADATTESTAAASFLLFEPSARASAMGNAYVAIADDANATYYNPAALADFNRRSVSTTFYKPVPNLASDIFSSFAAYTHPFDGIGNLGFSIIYTSLGKQFHTDAQGNSLGEFTSFGMGLGVSYGTHLFKNLSVGVTAKFIHENLSNSSNVQVGDERGKGAGTSFAGDFGLMWKPQSRLTIGASLRNVGPNMTFIDADQADPLPQNFTLGVAFVPYKNDKSRFLITTDIYKPLPDREGGFFSFATGWTNDTPDAEFKDIDYKIGAEWQYTLSEESAFALRAGYWHDEDGKRKVPTAGLGLKYNWATFDISYFIDNSAALRNVFRFSGGFNF